MKYDDEIKYHGDCKAVAQFHMDSGSSTSKCLELSSMITAELDEPRQKNAEAHCKELSECIKVDESAALVLAILATNDGYSSSPENIAKRSGIEIERIEGILADMYQAGLINRIDDSDGIILSRVSIRMLESDSTMEQVLANEFIDILLGSNLDPDDPYDSGTILLVAQNTKQYISSNPESNIAKFYEENRMDKLNDNEFRQFILLCKNFVLDFTSGIKADRSDLSVKTMINRGWAILFAAQGDSDSELIKQNNMILSVNVCKRLFGGCEEIIDYTSIVGQTQLHKWNEIEEKTLFYNEEENDGIQRLYQMAEEKEYQRITAALREHHLKVAVSGLLYGGPGTGKTELAKQIARATQRNLLEVDASKLIGSFVGESERNFRDLFRNFRYIEAISSKAPILFMDEADGLLGKRIPGAGNSRDRYINTIQNIILDELNKFEGILLATTNLSSNLDEAMDRRFLVKIEVNAPNEATRMKIWKSKLPQTSENELSIIARDYSFSGGHIDNVATLAIVESIMNGTNKVTLDLLIKYCKNASSFTNKDKRKRIGF